MKKPSYELEGIIQSLLQLSKPPSWLTLLCQHAGGKGDLVCKTSIHPYFISSTLLEFILKLKYSILCFNINLMF